jgi:hypothetical protein
MKYKKKPVVIEAYRWFENGDHPQDDSYRPFEDTGKIPEEAREGKVVRYFRHPDVSGEQQCKQCGNNMHWHGWIDTLEGGHIVCPGDYVITGVKGEKYPCKPDIFQATYEKVED